MIGIRSPGMADAIRIKVAAADVNHHLRLFTEIKANRPGGRLAFRVILADQRSTGRALLFLPRRLTLLQKGGNTLFGVFGRA